MLELLLKIVDKLKDLLELREKRAEKVFEKFIEPIYKDMELIHQDYLETIHELETLLPASNSDSATIKAACEKAFEFVVPKSRKLEAARDTIRVYVDSALRENVAVPKDVKDFISAVDAYLRPEFYLNRSRYYFWQRMLQNMIEDPTDRRSRSEVSRMSAEMLRDLKRNWQLVVETFTKIKLKVVSQ